MQGRGPESGPADQSRPAGGGPESGTPDHLRPAGGGPGAHLSGQVVAVFSGGGTGGHLYPALALADALTRARPDVHPFFVGAERGLEARVLPGKGLDHLLLPVRGFERGAMRRGSGLLEGVLATAGRFLAVLKGMARSLAVTGGAFSRLRPGLVVVTGGYAGGPAGLLAGLMGIPLALQEQNAFPGVTTRVLSRWSRQVHLAFPEARDALPRRVRSRTRISGNPIRVPTPGDAAADRAHFGLAPASRVLLVVGGSQGAVAVNRSVLEAVRGVEDGSLRRPEDLQILWATGLENLEAVEAGLRAVGSPGWVRALGYIHEMPRALRVSALAVSRAGAMATSEFLAWGIPSILVPLPTAAADHQARNAESLARAGAALHLPESELSGESLWRAVTTLLEMPEELDAMRRAALERGRPEATSQIAGALAELLPVAIKAPVGGAS